MRSQSAAQVYAAVPKSDGHIVATSRNQRWQGDLIDQTSRNAKLNDGYQHALALVDVFTRRVFAWPLRQKIPEETVGALCLAIRALGKPHELQTDNGGEFSGSFDKFLQAEK